MRGRSFASPPGPGEDLALCSHPSFCASGCDSGIGGVALPGFRSTVLLNAEAKCEQRGAGGAAAHTRPPAGMLLEELRGLSGGDHPARGGVTLRRRLSV